MTNETTPLRIGVALTLTGDPGEMLADAKALEAAGIDSLWVFPDERYTEAGIPAEDWASAYVVMSAIAAVTWRARLVVPRPRTAAPDVAYEAGLTHATCARIAQGRLLGKIETVWSDAAPEAARAVFASAREKRAEVECWLRVPFPDGRAAWDEQRRVAADAGASGIVLSNDPRLIDLLRNPDIVEDRSDLRLSFG
jgi:hypothetical protein